MVVLSLLSPSRRGVTVAGVTFAAVGAVHGGPDGEEGRRMVSFDKDAVRTFGREVAMFLPDVAFMLRAVVADPRVPQSAKLEAGAALAYLVSPKNKITNVIPVIGQLDDIAVSPSRSAGSSSAPASRSCASTGGGATGGSTRSSGRPPRSPARPACCAGRRSLPPRTAAFGRMGVGGWGGKGDRVVDGEVIGRVDESAPGGPAAARAPAAADPAPEPSASPAWPRAPRVLMIMIPASDTPRRRTRSPGGGREPAAHAADAGIRRSGRAGGSAGEPDDEAAAAAWLVESVTVDGEDWSARPVTGAASTKPYRAPAATMRSRGRAAHRGLAERADGRPPALAHAMLEPPQSRRPALRAPY